MKVLAPNTLLQNRYLVVHLIGKGGMGEVYLAVDQRLGSAVALKRTFFADDEMLGNAFEREARILGRLRHPVLPKVSDHFVENGNQYLVMEHITGDDLSKRLELTQKPFPLSWVLFWADQLMDALWYLHSHEPPIIHRDIKPQNLKLTDENNIILLDFGLSKSSIGDSRVSQNINSDSSSASSKSVIGYTPHYAPMEQIRGTGTNPRSDLYSLSATLYQLLTNSVPPDALSRADSLLNGSPDPVQPINELNAEVNKSVSDVILKGMAVSQDLRYTNAREMQKELRDAYAQLQKAMSANTIAFKMSDVAAPVQSEKTESLLSVVPLVSPDLVTETNVPPKVPAMETESLPAAQNQQNDFDATLHYNGEVQQFESKQSDIKTEVFSGGILPTEGDVIPTEMESQAQIPQVENYSPDATTPMISFDGEKVSVPQQPDFSSKVEKSEDSTPATAMFMPTGNTSQTENTPTAQNSGFTEDFSFTQDFKQEDTQYSDERNDENEYNSQPQTAAAAAGATPTAAVQTQKKSGNGKIFAILGALGLLLFLGIGAAGLGWWYLYGGGATTEVEPTSVPSQTPMPSPTASPVEVVIDNNTNTNTNSDTNSDVANTNTDTNSGTNTQIETDITTKTTPIPQNTRATTTPTIIRVNPTPKQTQTQVTPIKVPTKTPTKKDDSTKILQ